MSDWCRIVNVKGRDFLLRKSYDGDELGPYKIQIIDYREPYELTANLCFYNEESRDMVYASINEADIRSHADNLEDAYLQMKERDSGEMGPILSDN